MPRKAGYVTGRWDQKYACKEGSDDSSNHARRRDNGKIHHGRVSSEHFIGVIASKKLIVSCSYSWPKRRASEDTISESR